MSFVVYMQCYTNGLVSWGGEGGKVVSDCKRDVPFCMYHGGMLENSRIYPFV